MSHTEMAIAAALGRVERYHADLVNRAADCLLGPYDHRLKRRRRTEQHPAVEAYAAGFPRELIDALLVLDWADELVTDAETGRLTLPA